MEFTGPKPTGTSRQSKPVIERRQSVRLRVHSPAYANLNESSEGRGRELNEILDISEQGMSIQTSSPLKVDTQSELVPGSFGDQDADTHQRAGGLVR